MNDNVKFQEKFYNSREYGDSIKIDTRAKAILKMISDVKGKLLDIGCSERGDLNEVVEYINSYIKNKTTILDAGCGRGNYFKYFTNSFVVGLDIDRNALKEIITNNFIIQGDIKNLPLKSNCFDLVFSRSVLQYIKNPKEAINEFERVLKPNGYLIFTVPTKYSLFSIYRKILIKMKHYYGPEPVVLFTPEYIRNLLNPAFEIELLTGYDIWFPRYVLRYNKNHILNKILFELERKLPKWFLQNFAWEILCVAKKRKV